ncbi:hypothetical protein EV363DRAFT_1434886 [Boletus edulis]|nr:hypothetical protein EV363DRAFT_1434886 [Boletus edulis]
MALVTHFARSALALSGFTLTSFASAPAENEGSIKASRTSRQHPLRFSACAVCTAATGLVDRDRHDLYAQSKYIRCS